ncbi:50S ribosomal protein L24 [Spiroplasma endosymbiont of Amphibalanus improvisus]|uniref:50S ribosomal protein L24 n=1 Tax=Spiroplasma endosymbiont of Amphibalanus improvisus TaxID=3066327 RepID=UPI00313AC354
MKIKFKKGDNVRIISGSDSIKFKEGPITKILHKDNCVTIEGINNFKHVKASQTDQEGGIKEIPKKINVSKIALIDPKNKKTTTKISYKFKDGKKIRIARNSNHNIG